MSHKGTLKVNQEGLEKIWPTIMVQAVIFFLSPFSFLMVSFGGGCFRVFPFIRGMWEVDLVIK